MPRNCFCSGLGSLAMSWVRLAILPISEFMAVPKTTARARPRISEVPAKRMFGSSIQRNLPEINTG